MSGKRIAGLVRRLAAMGGILVFLVMALEFVIMISPFAFFFYSVFNPLFKFLQGHAATAWLTAFFLPHMILPPNLLLQAVRITGSVLFLVGTLMFLGCAGRVYLGKLLRWGAAEKGFYAVLRHPQYTGLAMLGLGMAILWPRLIVMAMLGVMLVLYYLLARNEEQRMLAQYGERYAAYLGRTGMFVPRWLEAKLAPLAGVLPSGPLGTVLGSAAAILVLVAVGFGLRTITLHSLLLDRNANVTLVAILPEDAERQPAALRGIAGYLAAHDGALLWSRRDYLGYTMPGDYVMQGMIADTGQQSHLHQHHSTPTLIADWILHPFAHLRRPPSAYLAQLHGMPAGVARRHHCPLALDDPTLDCATCPYRRVILVEVSAGPGERLAGRDCLSIRARRRPVCCVDLDTRTGQVVNIQPVGEGTAWQDVPTPVI